MKHRIIAAVCTALILTACGSTAGTSDTLTQVSESETTSVQTSIISETEETTAASSDTSASEETTTTAETTSTASETEETTFTEGEKPAGVPEYTMLETDGGIVGPEDNEEAALFDGDFETLFINNDSDYPLLAQTLSEVMDKRHDEYAKQTEELISLAKDHYSYSPEFFTGEYPMTYSCKVDNSVTRCDDKVFSYINSEEGYGGGAHGWNINVGKNIDSQTGEELGLSDICTDIPQLVDLLADKLEKEYSDAVTPEYQSLSGYREILTNAYGEDLQGYDDTWEDGTVYHMTGMNFVFVPDGVMFFSNSYDLTSYAGGTQYLTVLFSESDGLFNEKYISEGGDFHIKYDSYSAFYVDTDNDGNGERIISENVYDDEWNITGYTVKVGDKEYPIDNKSGEHDYIENTELERKDGKYTIRLYNNKSDLLAEIQI